MSHQTEATGEEVMREHARNLNKSPRPPLVADRTLAHAPREQVTETAEARHADFGNGMLSASKQDSSVVHPRLDAELMRSESKECFKLPDEMVRRDTCFASDFVNGDRGIVNFRQPLAGFTESGEAGWADGHLGFSVTLASFNNAPRINRAHADTFEVPGVSSNDGEIVGKCAGCDQRINRRRRPPAPYTLRHNGGPSISNKAIY